ncbi:AAEL015477-PA, partial [Aedes aegypti]
REKQTAGASLPLLRKNPGTINPNQTDYDLKQIKREVNRHINRMRRSLSTKIKETIQYLESTDALATMDQVDTAAVKAKITMGGTNRMPDYTFYEAVVQRDLENHIDALFRRRQDDDDEGEGGGDGAKGKDSKENGISVSLGGEDESESESEEEMPGGLVGLIANLSGGDEGSDVGALVGALSAAITNIFGGDENFGKVLGGYVGIAIEGFSGGGADNNGAFFGNFLGSVIAALSSDPDDENLPLRPKLFIDNFFAGLQEAKRKGDPDAEGGSHHKVKLVV